MNKGTLFGIGVGPGDPEMLTIKAVKILKSVRVVFAAESSKNDYSRAYDVVKDFIPEDTRVVHLKFPMSFAQNELNSAWKENANIVLAELDKGNDAAFITLGDPLTYSTYCYLIRTMTALATDLKIETVPGITAYHAAAARLNMPLAEGKESLMVVSGVSDMDRIKELAIAADNAVILKPYKKFKEIMDALEDVDDKTRVVLISHCGFDEERIELEAKNICDEKIPYLSLLLLKDRQSWPFQPPEPEPADRSAAVKDPAYVESAV